MNWNELFPQNHKPDNHAISNFVNYKLWDDICQYIEDEYKVCPSIEYSKCSMGPGWNVKYKKSNRSLCTLYPKENFYTCLITIGSKERMEVELILQSLCSYMQELYRHTKVFNGSRWLMVDVNSEEILENIKTLIQIRVKYK